MKSSVFLIMLLISLSTTGQRVLEWSIGEVEITCGEVTKLSYPLQVTIDNSSGDPVLATSTIRFFYDGTYLKNLKIEEILNGYTADGLRVSKPVFGEEMGFSSEKGVYVQFNLIDKATLNPIQLSKDPKQILKISFDVDQEAKYPLCVPFVFDNNTSAKGAHIDAGYLDNDAGIVGGYYLNKNYKDLIVADDEVVNFLWQKSKSFKGKLKKKKSKAGSITGNGCIKNPCKGKADCDNDGIPDFVETDSNFDNIPDDCQDLEALGFKMDENKVFSIYPVPYIDEITVSYLFDYPTKIQIDIFDANGNLLRQLENKKYLLGTLKEEKINLARIENQVLFVRITTNRSVETKKIIPVATR